MHTLKVLQEYQTTDGKKPFRSWLDSLKDRRGRVLIEARLLRLSKGNAGDVKFLGQGVFELRVHFGPGYRVYFGEEQGLIVVLLCGGDKSQQSADIEKAQAYWLDYR